MQISKLVLTEYTSLQQDFLLIEINLKLNIMLYVKDIRPLQYGKIHEVLRVDEDKIVTTTGIVLYYGQFELID